MGGESKQTKADKQCWGGKKEKKKVKFPGKLCQEDHLTYQCPLMKQAQKLLKQQPVVLKDPFLQVQNATLSDSKNVEGTHNTSPADQSYINMVRSQTLLQTRAKNYESESSQKDKQPAEASTPLSIEKPA